MGLPLRFDIQKRKSRRLPNRFAGIASVKRVAQRGFWYRDRDFLKGLKVISKGIESLCNFLQVRYDALKYQNAISLEIILQKST